MMYRFGVKGILIRFCRLSNRNDVMKNRVMIKKHEALKNVWLNDDVPEQVRQQRAELRAVYNLAKTMAVNAHIRNMVIVIDGARYKHTQLDSLPHGLSLKGTACAEPIPHFVLYMQSFIDRSHYQYSFNQYSEAAACPF